MGNADTDIHDTGALFQIEEPASARKVPLTPGRAIGIDLGTTHSLVAVAPNGADPRTVADGEGRCLLPSVVSYVEDPPTVGWAARTAQLEAPSRVLSSVKRFMGRGTGDVDFSHPYTLVPPAEGAADIVRIDVGGDKVVTPMEVSARILEVLAARAEQELGEPPTGAVITVPAYFDEAQRQATKDAGRIAGLEVYRLLAEPTAAALAYGLDRGGQGLFAVYDLGGGTFDISILRLRDGVFQVLATGGDSALGGDDFDRAVAQLLLEKAGLVEPTPLQREQARVAARDAKEALSDKDSVEVPLPDGATITLSRETLEATIGPVAERTVAPCRQALKDAGVRAKELDGVVLVGGSTRTPLVRQLVESTFRQPPLADIDPDRVVAYGAAIQADVLSGSARDGVTLLDVAPLSLGLETMGGIVETIIPRNAAIPIAARQVFTNYSEQQTGMMVHVLQGERELADDCRSLAKFDLKGIPQLPPSMARIEITFELDADALLTVTARELMTGVRQTVQVKPTYGLSDEEVDRLVIESLDSAEDDFTRRNLAEARVELGRVVLAVGAALWDADQRPGLLEDAERASIDTAMQSAQVVMAPDGPTDHKLVVAAREHLESVSEGFARRRMERALLAGMEGMSVTEVSDTLAADEDLDDRRGGHGPEQVSKG